MSRLGFLWLASVFLIGESFETMIPVHLRRSFLYKRHRLPCKRSLFRSKASLSATATQDKTWHGEVRPASAYTNHILVGEKDIPVTAIEAIERSCANRLTASETAEQGARNGNEGIPRKNDALTPEQVLRLGSAYFLPSELHQINKTQDRALNLSTNDHPDDLLSAKTPGSYFSVSVHKPQRLSEENSTMPLSAGDYLRVHHTPRRFLNVYKFDWSVSRFASGDARNDSVIVAVDLEKGYIIVNKPPMVPVHPSVDNTIENVVHQLQNPHSSSVKELDYVAAIQRIDINTSGLLAVATSKPFAAYFSNLLKNKTDFELSGSSSASSRAPLISKGYRCLVCLNEPSDPNGWSVSKALGELRGFVEKETIIQHWLEKSIKAPKRFEPEVPVSDAQNWLECLMQISHVSEVIPLATNDGETLRLIESLWPSARLDSNEPKSGMPPKCRAIVEVQVRLLTGRTHQIRGQLARLGFPIAGDEQYGGAALGQITVMEESETREIEPDSVPQLLALQCCELEFVDPDFASETSTQPEQRIRKNKRKKQKLARGKPSTRRNTFRLDSAWWTPHVKRYQTAMEADSSIDGATTSLADQELVKKMTEKGGSADRDQQSAVRMDLLPPFVQLSPGRNKYVLIRASQKDLDEPLWFVKSAAPSECGGPYHANVARDLVEWLEAAGLDVVVVTGGGRIDYRPGLAHVYGFSYGFGKGDHRLAASIIEREMDGVVGTYDDSDKLY